MKKLIIMAAIFFAAFTPVSAQTTWRGNTIVATSASKGTSKATKTPFNYQAKDGKTYSIYISAKGSCFIVRTSSKTGKEYKQYLGKEVSQEICRKLKRQYKGK